MHQKPLGGREGRREGREGDEEREEKGRGKEKDGKGGKWRGRGGPQFKKNDPPPSSDGWLRACYPHPVYRAQIINDGE